MKERFIFVFLDGVGIGEASETNPFYAAKAKYLPFYNGALQLPDGTPVKAIDALLGVEGLPQSATGQTSLYTGENIPKLIGAHKGSYPNRVMRQMILKKNILTLLKRKGLDAVFVNAYPMHSDLFTEEHVRIDESGEFFFSDQFPPLFKRRISTTSCIICAASQKPFSEIDIEAERSIFHDYNNQWLNEKGLNLPLFSPEKAGEILSNALMQRDFILYEYFQTDVFGHRESFQRQVQLISDLDRLLAELFRRLDPTKHTMLLTSDHGNIEDSSNRSHTLNPVPLITWGKHSEQLRCAINDLTQVTPAIVNLMGSQ